ncbi:MAG TPA: GNAT family N-acetyltransferase [Candidatus Limiplasma sp.]|nr:GNAT family N-acetyltransferase [Candidatus Limiplasma sp.]
MIRQASRQDIRTVSLLARQLWPEHTLFELEAEYASLLSSDACAVFLFIEQSQPAAFAQCQLRRDYVEGTHGSPVGYLEGVYVEPEYRRQGIAAELLRRCEQWAKAKGCAEFASDCELHNTDSLHFHLHAGFTEANRVICFTKKIGEK